MDTTKKFEIITVDETDYFTQYTPQYLRRKTWVKPDPRKIISFIPGTINEIFVTEGQQVEIDTNLLILEAMKMKNKVLSPVAGIVKAIYCVQGDIVPKGKLLIEIE